MRSSLARMCRSPFPHYFSRWISNSEVVSLLLFVNFVDEIEIRVSKKRKRAGQSLMGKIIDVEEGRRKAKR